MNLFQIQPQLQHHRHFPRISPTSSSSSRSRHTPTPPSSPTGTLHACSALFPIVNPALGPSLFSQLIKYRQEKNKPDGRLNPLRTQLQSRLLLSRPPARLGARTNQRGPVMYCAVMQRDPPS
jgi:hypothetical protein